MTEADPKEEISKKAELVKFAYDLGISICIPLVILAGLGIWADKKFQTKPLFMIVGLLLSLITTGISINKKIKEFKL